MATINTPVETEVTIPAHYLEDFTTALLAVVGEDAEWACSQDREFRAGGAGSVEGPVRHLCGDVRLLEQVLGASGNTTVASDPTVLVAVFGAMLAERSDDTAAA